MSRTIACKTPVKVNVRRAVLEANEQAHAAELRRAGPSSTAKAFAKGRNDPAIEVTWEGASGPSSATVKSVAIRGEVVVHQFEHGAKAEVVVHGGVIVADDGRIWEVER